MPTQGQYNTMLQPYREINILVNVMDYNMVVLDEISGLTTQSSISIDSDSDIRRTANISMVLKNDFTQIDDMADSVRNLYWTSGNAYWYDKLIQIMIGINNVVTNEIEWVNEGVYLINAPSVTFDATTNELSFQAVDLMSKMTGLRDGNLENLSYIIPYGESITGAIEGLITQQGFTKYILYTPPIDTTPYEIKVDAGGTTYDLLSQLRDINPNWEMFFDTNGVFIFQQIPSGKVIVNPDSGEEGEPTPIVDDLVWDKLMIDYSLDTDFENVKNYVEVYGKTITPDEWVEGISESGNVLTANINYTFSAWQNLHNGMTDVIEGIPVNINQTSGDLTQKDTPITSIIVHFVDQNITINTTQEGKPFQLNYNNQYYVINISTEGATSTNNYYMGYLQPVGIAWENNPESPFYVGEQQSGISNPTTPNDYLVDRPVFNSMTRYICSGDDYDNIYTNELAMERASYELYLHSRLHDNITIRNVPIYWLDVNQIIAFTLPQETEVAFWLIKSISTDVSASGTQTISAIRYYPLYPTT